jgi:hypothetical protein
VADVTVSRAHADALLAALRALTAQFGVYDAEVPATPATPYLVQYPDGGMRERGSLTADHDQVTSSVQWTCVGTSRNEALWVADQACQLLGRVLTVPGRSCWPLTQLGASPVSRDDTNRTASNRPLFTAVVDVQLTSTPA